MTIKDYVIRRVMSNFRRNYSGNWKALTDHQRNYIIEQAINKLSNYELLELISDAYSSGVY